jgi:thermitase
MNRTATIAFAALLSAVLAGCSFGSASQGASGSAKSSGTGIAGYQTFEPETEAALKSADPSVVNKDYVIAKASLDFEAGKFTALGATVEGSFNFNGATYYRLKKAGGTVKLIGDLRKLSGVYYAEHELFSSIPEGEKGSAASSSKAAGSRDIASIASVLNDPLIWGRFGHFETTKAIDAYKNYGVGSNTVYVVDIDTGINMAHEDFHDASGKSIVEYAKSAFAEDGTFVGYGSAFVDVPAESDWDDEAHGSHTAGTIAAVGNNGKGVAGVCWKNVKLISYKCFSNSSSSSGSNWAVYGGVSDLIAWKQKNNIAQTIPVNMSLGGSYAGQFELEMINAALDNDIMVIASMGNDGQNKAQYPAAYAGVTAVGATTASATKVSFSNSGNYISVMAPGYNIYSTASLDSDGDGKTSNEYEDMSGTSMAAPFVTGAVAYLLSFNPKLKPDQIKTILEETAVDMGAAGYDEDTGYGLVNVNAAEALASSASCPASGSVYSTKTAKISVANTNSHYDSGLTSYPDAVVGLSVYLYDSTGAYVAVGLTNGTDGSVEFKLLKPGDYTAQTSYGGTTKSVTFSLTNSSDVERTLSFDVATLFIQTMVNSGVANGSSSSADSIITVFDANGSIVTGPYDKGSLDSLSVTGLSSGATYYIEVSPYYVTDSAAYCVGEYGLNIGLTAVGTISTTNGRYVDSATPTDADDTFEENDTLETAKLITVDRPYGLYLGDDDYFKFIMP